MLGDVEYPRQDDRDRQPDDGEDDDRLQCPLRGLEGIKKNALDLDDNPCDADIETRSAEHLSS